MIRFSDRLLYLSCILLVIADCYVDDVWQHLGIGSQTIMGLTGYIGPLYLLVWSLLIALNAFLLYKLTRIAGLRGGAKTLSIVLLIFASIVSVTSHGIRIKIATDSGIVDKDTVPDSYFVETYAARMAVYSAMLAVSVFILFMIVRRPGIPRYFRLGALLLCISMIVAILVILTSGIQVLAGSVYWQGEPILRGSVYMGSVPRPNQDLVEPVITFIFLAGTGLLIWHMVRHQSEPSYFVFLATISLLLLLQALPAIGRIQLTEALYATDFYYGFKVDRSISFPSIPLLFLLLAGGVSRTLENFPGRDQETGATTGG
jgi:hypothetical protein